MEFGVSKESRFLATRLVGFGSCALLGMTKFRLSLAVGRLKAAGSAGANLFVVMKEREDVVAFELFAAMEKIEFHDEGEAGDFAAQ